jgi:hypothetical protein
MTNLFDSTTRRMALPERRADGEVTVNVAEDDILSAEDYEPEELEITLETLRPDGETRRASPELVGRHLARSERDPADELEFDRELELPEPAPRPDPLAPVAGAIETSAPTLDDLLDDALQKCLARQISEAMVRAVEPPPICEPLPALQPRRGRRDEAPSKRRALWSALAVVGGALLGVALAFALLRFLG